MLRQQPSIISENMAVCYFNRDYECKYKCSYEMKASIIDIEIEYDISDEVPAVNGVKMYGPKTEYRKRDILIVDHQNNTNILVKEAYYAGHSSVWGTPDEGTTTKFQSSIYFEHAALDKICLLPETPKVSAVRIYSKAINDLLGHPSRKIKDNDEEYAIILSRQNCAKCTEMNLHNNIKRITLADNWKCISNDKTHNMSIDFTGYVEIEIAKRVNYEQVSDYIYELEIFMQLYYPDKFRVDKIYVKVGKIFYKISIPHAHKDLNYKERNVRVSVEEPLLDFLKKCYATIPYRKSKTEIRNIPYIVMNTSRGLEDNFLMFYRFIECYYKKQQINNINKTFITYSIKENYAKEHDLSEDEIERLAQEIVCLRNHYVHAGYYIKNSILRVSFDRINRKKNPKDYTANNVDAHWIYERMRILYRITINIIFKDMLGYKRYNFDKDL